MITIIIIVIMITYNNDNNSNNNNDKVTAGIIIPLAYNYNDIHFLVMIFKEGSELAKTVFNGALNLDHGRLK